MPRLLLRLIPWVLSLVLAASPVYPGPVEEEDDGVLIPTISLQQENFYLAVTDAAQPLIDNQKIADAVRAAVGESNANFVVAVDRRPNNLTGAAQLVRGVTMFSDTSYLLLADDWVEHGKELGYVKPGWIAIGIMLPEPGGQVETAVDPGRNISRPESLDPVLGAGREDFAAEDWEAGISAVTIAAAEQLTAPPDRTWMKIAALILLGVLILASIIGLLVSRRRTRAADRARMRAVRAGELSDLIPGMAHRLSKLDLPTIRPPLGWLPEEYAARRSEAVRQAGAVEPIGPGQAVSESQLAQLEDLHRRLQELIDAQQAADRLIGRGSFATVLANHRGRLEQLAQIPDTDAGAKLPQLPELRALLIEHTNRLDQLPTDREETTERLCALRRELDAFVLGLPAELRGERRPDDIDRLLALGRRA